MVPETQNQSVAQLTILQVLPALKVGGVERGTTEFAIYLKQQGHKPVVISAGGPLVDELKAHKISHIQLNVGRKSIGSLFFIKKLRQIMLDLKVDVVHARSRLPAWLCYWALKGLKASEKPHFVTTLHGLHSVNRYSSIMARGDAVIAVSKTAEDYLYKHFGNHLKSKPHMIYRGIDPQFSCVHEVNQSWESDFRQKLPKGQSYKTVLMPGRLSRVKGVENLIDWLKSTVHNCKLLLTARQDESSYSQKIKKLFAQHQVSNQVVWLGIERNMVDLYASVDLVVSVNNKAESFGRTVLEALSVGTPVVAFAHGGVAEIMSELYPLGCVEWGNNEELAKRIDAFIEGAPEVEAHKKFSNQSMFEQTMAVYQTVLSEKAKFNNSN